MILRLEGSLNERRIYLKILFTPMVGDLITDKFCGDQQTWANRLAFDDYELHRTYNFEQIGVSCADSQRAGS